MSCTPACSWLDRPAACVDDPAGQGGRTPAGEPVEHDDLGSGPGRLKRSADARGAETDHYDVGLKIPSLRHWHFLLGCRGRSSGLTEL